MTHHPRCFWALAYPSVADLQFSPFQPYRSKITLSFFANFGATGWLLGNSQNMKGDKWRRTASHPMRFGYSSDAFWLLFRCVSASLPMNPQSLFSLMLSIIRNSRECPPRINIFYHHNPSCRCSVASRCSPRDSLRGAGGCRRKSGRTPFG